jgi:hypothetical protein
MPNAIISTVRMDLSRFVLIDAMETFRFSIEAALNIGIKQVQKK